MRVHIRVLEVLLPGGYEWQGILKQFVRIPCVKERERIMSSNRGQHKQREIYRRERQKTEACAHVDEHFNVLSRNVAERGTRQNSGFFLFYCKDEKNGVPNGSVCGHRNDKMERWPIRERLEEDVAKYERMHTSKQAIGRRQRERKGEQTRETKNREREVCQSAFCFRLRTCYETSYTKTTTAYFSSHEPLRKPCRIMCYRKVEQKRELLHL